MSEKRRVTYVIDDLGHGGTQRQLYLTLRSLNSASDYSVIVLSNLVEPYAPLIRALGVHVDVVQRRGSLDALRLHALTGRLRMRQTRIAHAMLDASGVYTYLAARMCRMPVVLSMRNEKLHVPAGLRAAVLTRALKNAAAVTANSEAGRKFLLDGIGVPAGRIHLVPNIVDVPAVSRDPHALKPVIGVVGRLVDWKRFDAVLDALPLVRRAVPDARVVLVGDGPERQKLENRARRADIAGAVEFTGAVDDATSLMDRFACLVVTSASEGTSNVALEALARGVPVVTVATGDLLRIVTDGVTGVIARDISPEALSEAIVRALTSSSLRESAAREGPRLMRERHSPEAARDVLLKLYASLR
jgi:glycosyltransferase involved in cell wall biosynthesis